MRSVRLAPDHSAPSSNASIVLTAVSMPSRDHTSLWLALQTSECLIICLQHDMFVVAMY